MLVRIMYRDGRFDMVKGFFLDWLIESGRIAKFRRSNGWAVLDRDPVRRPGCEVYRGTERRSEAEPPLIALLALALKHERNSKEGYVDVEANESGRWERDH